MYGLEMHVLSKQALPNNTAIQVSSMDGQVIILILFTSIQVFYSYEPSKTHHEPVTN